MRDLFAAARDACGSVDLVIANAGIIQVAPVESLDAADFDDAMRSIFHAALHTSLEALPHLKESASGGRLALISSVGGLLGVPHLVPYACAKSAVGTLAEGLRAEMSGTEVSVTAVYPGLMRTGSHLHAMFGGAQRQEYGWFSTVASTPLVSMSARRAAERIVRATVRRRARLVLTPRRARRRPGARDRPGDHHPAQRARGPPAAPRTRPSQRHARGQGHRPAAGAGGADRPAGRERAERTSRRRIQRTGPGHPRRVNPALVAGGPEKLGDMPERRPRGVRE